MEPTSNNLEKAHNPNQDTRPSPGGMNGRVVRENGSRIRRDRHAATVRGSVLFPSPSHTQPPRLNVPRVPSGSSPTSSPNRPQGSPQRQIATNANLSPKLVRTPADLIRRDKGHIRHISSGSLPTVEKITPRSFKDLNIKDKISYGSSIPDDIFASVFPDILQAYSEVMPTCKDEEIKKLILCYERNPKRLKLLTTKAVFPRLGDVIEGEHALRKQVMRRILKIDADISFWTDYFLSNGNYIEVTKILNDIKHKLSKLNQKILEIEEINQKILELEENKKRPSQQEDSKKKLDLEKFSPADLLERKKKLESEKHDKKRINLFIFTCEILIKISPKDGMSGLSLFKELKSKAEETKDKIIINKFEAAFQCHYHYFFAAELIGKLLEPAQKDENFSNYICDVAYGYTWFTTLERLVKTLCVCCNQVTEDYSKKLLMLNLLIEVLRVTPPQPFEDRTFLILDELVRYSAESQNEKIRDHAKELTSCIFTYKKFLMDGKWAPVSPRLSLLGKTPSLTNVKLVEAKPPVKGTPITYAEFKAAFFANETFWSGALNQISADIQRSSLQLFRTIPLLDFNKAASKHITVMQAYAQFSMKLSFFAPWEIVIQESVEKRVKMWEFFVLLAENLHQLKDYHSASAIIFGLCHPNIPKREIKENVNPKMLSMQSNLESYYDGTHNFKLLRQLMDSAFSGHEAYTIPLHVLTKDLEFINSGNPSVINEKLNFDKLQLYAVLAYKFLTVQRKKFTFDPPTTDIEKIITNVVVDEDKLQEIVTLREQTANLQKSASKNIIGKFMGIRP